MLWMNVRHCPGKNHTKVWRWHPHSLFIGESKKVQTEKDGCEVDTQVKEIML